MFGENHLFIFVLIVTTVSIQSVGVMCLKYFIARDFLTFLELPSFFSVSLLWTEKLVPRFILLGGLPVLNYWDTL